MSDLISRSAVLKQLEDWKKNWENTEDSYEKTWTLTCIDFYIRLITNQPTAYDVEKVVECLEEKVELAHKRYVDCPVNSPCYERYRTQYNERRMCLDIVKGGGVNDD